MLLDEPCIRSNLRATANCLLIKAGSVDEASADIHRDADSSCGVSVAESLCCFRTGHGAAARRSIAGALLAARWQRDRDLLRDEWQIHVAGTAACDR